MAYTAIYPASYSTSTVKATSEESAETYPWFAVDPSLDLDGAGYYEAWMSSTAVPQKFNVAFASSFILGQLVFNNSHASGSFTDRGAKNISVYGTDATGFADTTYANTTGLTLIGTILLEEHTAVDESDPQTFTFPLNETEYQYYVFRIADNHGNASYIGFRDVDFFESEPEIYEWNGSFGFNSTFTAESDGAVNKPPPYISASFGFASSISAIIQGAKVNAGFGFDASIPISANAASINSGFGFDCSTMAVGTRSADINSGFGFDSSLSVGATAASEEGTIDGFNAGFGFGCSLEAHTSINAQLDCGFGFDALFDIERTNPLSVNSGFGFNCSVNIPGTEDCELPLFTTDRWC